jgi:hypothetical protein
MKRLLLIVAVVFALHLPALAQDDATPTPEQTPIVTETPAPEQPPAEEPARDRSETVITVALIVVSIVAVVFGSQVVMLARVAYMGQSPLVQEFIRLNSTRLLTELDRRAALTETKLDDEALAEIRRIVKEIVAEKAATGQ